MMSTTERKTRAPGIIRHKSMLCHKDKPRHNLPKPDSLVSVRSLTPQFSSRPLTNTHVMRSLLPQLTFGVVRSLPVCVKQPLVNIG